MFSRGGSNAKRRVHAETTSRDRRLWFRSGTSFEVERARDEFVVIRRGSHVACDLRYGVD